MGYFAFAYGDADYETYLKAAKRDIELFLELDEENRMKSEYLLNIAISQLEHVKEVLNENNRNLL